MHARFGQAFGNPDLLILGEDDAGLLLAVAQGNVVKLDLLGEMELLDHRLGKVPRADEPLIGFPGFSRHEISFLQKLWMSNGGLQHFRVNRITRRFSAEYADHFLRRLGLKLRQGFFRIETGVRRKDHIIAAEQR